jgi:hypothetical protein
MCNSVGFPRAFKRYQTENERTMLMNTVNVNNIVTEKATLSDESNGSRKTSKLDTLIM